MKSLKEKNKKMRIKVYFFSALVLVLLFLSGYVVSSALAAPPFVWLWGGSEDAQMAGYAMGTADGNESGVGWVSMDCAKDGKGGATCATSNYVVDADINGKLSGYGWSDNVGWIDFGGSNCTTVCPAPAGKYCAASCANPSGGSQAEVIKNTGTGATSGWARIVGIAQETVNTKYGNNSGVDAALAGWISVQSDALGDAYGWNGENQNNPPVITNYANGSGWMKFFAVPKLKICLSNCNNGGSPLNDKTLAVALDSGVDLKACYDGSAGCTDDTNDVTAETTVLRWNHSADTPQKAVRTTLDVPNKLYQVTGIETGSKEDIFVRYNASAAPNDNAKVTISVTCTRDPVFCDSSPKKATTCTTAFFEDNCNARTCKGGKNCSAWSEEGKL
jgi:hypothetical protein